MSKFFPSIVIFLLSFHLMAGQISPELTLENNSTVTLDGSTPYLDSNTPALSIDLDSEMKAIQSEPLQNIEFSDSTNQQSAPTYRNNANIETPSQVTNTDDLTIDMRRELELDELKTQWGELKKEARSIKDELESEVNTSLSSIGLDITQSTESKGHPNQSGGYHNGSASDSTNNIPSLTLYYHKIMNFIDDHPILIFVIACCLFFVIVAKSVLTFSR